MKKIDLSTWNRKKHYDWFSTFSNPTYGLNVRLDVSKIIEYTKTNHQSFFICMLYIVTKGCNMVDAMHLRIIDHEVYEFETINPSYTIMIDADTYENTRNKNAESYAEFYQITHDAIEKTKAQTSLNANKYNPEGVWDEYYMTCLPWTDYESMSHPIPDDLSSLSVPRICWGKYSLQNDNHYYLTLNITVNHMLVDGYDLSKVFNNIKEMLENPEKYLN